MRKYLPMAIVGLSILIITSCTHPQQQSNTSSIGVEDTLRLLVIGNSFSNNATRFLPDLAIEQGKKLKLAKAQIGGSSLERHWQSVEIAMNYPDSSKGKPYNGKSLLDFLTSDDWDIVTIQQVSMLSCDTSEYRPFAKYVYDYIKKFQPEAEIVLHQTWAYRSDAKRFCQITEGTHAQSDEEMWQNSRRAYHTIADELGLRIIPVGDAFWSVCSGEHRYRVSPDFNPDGLVEPNIPTQKNSLHTGYYWRDNTLRMDSNHANKEGEFLGALVWYGFLFEDKPSSTSYVPEGSDTTFVNYLREVADSILL